MSDEELLDEARELVEQCSGLEGAMSGKDRDFFSGIAEKFERYGDRARISRSQVFWLRDIRDRYAL